MCAQIVRFYVVSAICQLRWVKKFCEQLRECCTCVTISLSVEALRALQKSEMDEHTLLCSF